MRDAMGPSLFKILPSQICGHQLDRYNWSPQCILTQKRMPAAGFAAGIGKIVSWSPADGTEARARNIVYIVAHLESDVHRWQRRSRRRADRSDLAVYLGDVQIGGTVYTHTWRQHAATRLHTVLGVSDLHLRLLCPLPEHLRELSFPAKAVRSSAARENCTVSPMLMLVCVRQWRP